MAAQVDSGAVEEPKAIDPNPEKEKTKDITDTGAGDSSKPADDREKSKQANVGGNDVPDTGGNAADSGQQRQPILNPGDIPIKFVNKTGENDYTVVVFLRNESPNAVDTPFVAWHVIRTQTSALFSYPIQSEVGAIYDEDGMKMRAGPLPAFPGSTWDFIQENKQSTPTLKEGK